MYNLALITERMNIIRHSVERLKLLAKMPIDLELFCRYVVDYLQ